MPIEISGKATSNVRAINSTAISSEVKSLSIASRNTARPTADTVSLTGAAAYLRQLESRLAALPVVDVQRTESIKKAIVDGRFTIDPVRVADKLLRFESMLHYHVT